MKKLILAIVFAALSASFSLSAAGLESDLRQLSELIKAQKLEGATQTDGKVLFLYGRVLGTDGSPVNGATVEIWQTDQAGIYDHPDDPKTEQRSKDFRFFGSTQVDAQGWYVFKTLLPGIYEPRPRHIHFKVKLKSRTMLTGQFYFGEEVYKPGNAPAESNPPNRRDLLELRLVEYANSLSARGNVYLSTGKGGKFLPTPSQTEGPYYPVKGIESSGNNLFLLSK